jgi:DNA-binding transcriptional MerR regulator
MCFRLHNLGARRSVVVKPRRVAELRLGGAVSSTIGELSLATGVPIATLRDWDRRHGLSPSQRTIGNHRRYTEADAAMVVRVRDLVASGLRLRASVVQARADSHSERPRGSEAVQADHQRLRESVTASREASINRRDQLVAERVALVARRESLVRDRPPTAAGLIGHSAAQAGS